MAEYINRDLIVKNSMLHTWKKADLLRAIKEVPTADVVKVVRCKDCKRRYTDLCALWYATTNESMYIREHGDDFWCAFGERKESD